MSDIIALVFFASLANADDFVEIAMFGQEYEEFLREYLELPNGIPSHDTIQRVFAMVSSEFLSGFQRLKQNERLDAGSKRSKFHHALVRDLLRARRGTRCSTAAKVKKSRKSLR